MLCLNPFRFSFIQIYFDTEDSYPNFFVSGLIQGSYQNPLRVVLSRGIVQWNIDILLISRYPTHFSISYSFLDIYEKGAF
jgi:hypothetical protein